MAHRKGEFRRNGQNPAVCPDSGERPSVSATYHRVNPPCKRSAVRCTNPCLCFTQRQKYPIYRSNLTPAPAMPNQTANPAPQMPLAPPLVTKISRGRSAPLGATPFADGINFVLIRRHGATVTLALQAAEDATILAEFPLHPIQHRTADPWHVSPAILPSPFL